MKKVFVLVIVLVLVGIGVSWQNNAPSQLPEEDLRTYVLAELKAVQSNLTFQHENESIDLYRKAYLAARTHYKHVEWFVEFQSPNEAKYFINGPLVTKYTTELDVELVEPHGFQRIEELLYKTTPFDQSALALETKQLVQQINTLIGYYQHVQIPVGSPLEMSQLCLYRLASLTLNGYDATLVQNNITEATYNLESLTWLIRLYEHYYKPNIHSQKLVSILTLAKSYLQQHRDYNTFNRLLFITQYIQPAYRALIDVHQAYHLPWDDTKKALNLKDKHVFGQSSFNMRYFSMYYNDTIRNEAQATLGKRLFFDPILSGNQLISCATCHQPDKAFTDGLTTSRAFDSTRSLARNTPTLLNVALQKSFFADGKANQLEQQIHDVVHNQEEMNSTLELVVSRLKSKKSYVTQFASAFQHTPDSAITTYAVQKAITEYEKTLLSFNSRFDAYINGQQNALSNREINGYNLFAGKALCGSCHFFPLFNGTVPPVYNDSEFEVIGTPATKDNKTIDADLGRLPVTHSPIHHHAFKTPTIRNIALTAPYMHNGVFTQLEEVVEFYHRGGGSGHGYQVENQTLPFDSLQLSKTDKEDIVLFMKSLTDRSLAHAKTIAGRNKQKAL